MSLALTLTGNVDKGLKRLWKRICYFESYNENLSLWFETQSSLFSILSQLDPQVLVISQAKESFDLREVMGKTYIADSCVGDHDAQD